MVYFQFRQMKAVALAAAGMWCLAASEKLVAQSEATSPVFVAYTATGVFATPAISGDDLFELSGEPFNINVVVSSAAKPAACGFDCAKYTRVEMIGAVSSGLEPTMLLSIVSGGATLELATGNPDFDLLTFFSPVQGGVIGYPINIQATIQMPAGTIATPAIHPFMSTLLGPCQQPVPPGPCVDQVTYSDPQTGKSTTLGIASGTMVATALSSGSGSGATTVARASVQLHAEGAQVITAHADGTQSVR
jgi:hypothetical protein